MIENDSREECNGIHLGASVDFRWNHNWHRGRVIRLMQTSAVVEIGVDNSLRVRYRQIKQSTKYTP